MVALRQDEWDELSPEEKRAHREAEFRNVFGADAKRDRSGKPIEMGIGSPSQPTENHFLAVAAALGQDEADRQRADAVKRGVWPPKPRAEAL
jgi:hypothetical protein